MLAEFEIGTRKVWATFLRDARLMMSYRVAFFLGWFAIVASVVGLWFVSKLVPESAVFGNGRMATYFNYAVVNVAFVTLQSTALLCFENSIRNEQVYGTFEAVLATPTSVSLVVLAASAWAFTFALIQVALYLSVAMLLGLDLHHVNLASLAIFLILSITATVPIGIIGAAVVVRFKQTAPTQSIFGRASTVLAGVLFPVSLLPFWLQGVSWMLPLTHALAGIRGAFDGLSLQALSSDAIWLSAATLVLLPCSLYAFRAAVVRAKADGTLGQY
ncbi:MAG TPA: ABC transporter permease [Candidatus Acidoferrales bacterium]|nr:ABC transporter permease [Candidatus Acidoferrales bacterium]